MTILAKNPGKKFEEDFESSVPENLLCERYKDSPIRFRKVHNPADFWINTGKLVLLVECKSTKSVSLPLNNIGMEQVWKMIERTCKLNTFGGFAINFRSLSKTYFVFLEDFLYWYLCEYDRESLSLEWVRTHGYEIPSARKIKRYRYGVASLLKWVEQQKYVSLEGENSDV